MSEKNQKATPQKLKDSRKKGQVQQSQDIPKLFIFAGIMETCLLLVDSSVDKLQSVIIFSLDRMLINNNAVYEELLWNSLITLAPLVMLPCAIACFLRVLGGWVQFGPLFSVAALKPKAENMSPMGQLKKMFAGKQFVQLLINFIKAFSIAGIFYLCLYPQLNTLVLLIYGTLDEYWHAIVTILTHLLRWILLLLVVISVIDFFIQRYFFLKQQKMSREDIMDEYKKSEGSPEIKNARRSMAYELSQQPGNNQTKANMKDADVLLVNPTHFAVGLHYRTGITPLPKLLFKASGANALALIDQAQKSKIPVIKKVWLARKLYRTSNEGDYIPRDCLRPVAEIYKLLQSLEKNLVSKKESSTPPGND